MSSLRPILILWCLLCAPGCDSPSKSSAQTRPEAKPTDAEAPKAGGENFRAVNIPVGDEITKVLAQHAAKAAKAGLKPHVELWADWCPPCKAIEKSMDDPRMKKAFAGTYLIRLDTDQWGGKLGATGLNADVIPIFYELDPNGKLTGRSIDGGAWGENTTENMAPPLHAYFHGDNA